MITFSPASFCRSSRLLLGLWLSLLGAWLHPARLAAEDHWVFVPVVTTQLPRHVSAAQLSAALENELRTQRKSVTSNQDAAMLFETRHSSEPVQLDTDELSRLLRSVSVATRHLALGELPQAQQALEGVYALSGPARDYLNREAARARKIFDTCLMTAYLWEREQKHQEALHQMVECSRNFPGFRPEGRAYPPELRAVFEQAKQQLSQQPMTTLLVESRNNSGCGVRLNGIEVGKSPTHFSDVRAGVMRVQLECKAGVAGRIHAAELRPGENRLDIDDAFDAVVRSQSGLWLQYESDSARAARMDTDLAQIQEALGTRQVVGLVVDGGANPRVHLRSLSGTPREVASLVYSSDTGAGYSHDAVTSAVQSLQPRAAETPTPTEEDDSGQERVRLRLSDEPLPAADPAATTATHTEPDRQQNLTIGIPLALAGVGGLATGWVLYAILYSNRQQLANAQAAQVDPSSDGAEYASDPWLFGSAAPIAVTAAGAAVLSVSEYFWLPDSEGVPALAWVVGGVGAALAVTGVVISIVNTPCVEDAHVVATTCGELTGDAAFGPMIALHGLPLLAAPLSYAFRQWLRPAHADLALSVEPTRGAGAWLRMSGRF